MRVSHLHTVEASEFYGDPGERECLKVDRYPGKGDLVRVWQVREDHVHNFTYCSPWSADPSAKHLLTPITVRRDSRPPRGFVWMDLNNQGGLEIWKAAYSWRD